MSLNNLRDDLEEMQQAHPVLGEIYTHLIVVKDTLLDHCFLDGTKWLNDGELPILSLEAHPWDHPAGRWLGKFMEVGPLGFGNVISLNMMGFRHAAEIPTVIAHELCHWFDRPNTGHGDSFWGHMMDRVGLDRNGLKSLTWVRLEEHFPMEELSEIVLNP